MLAHLRKHGVQAPADAGLVFIGPLTIRQLNLFAHKVALALYFEHFKVPLPEIGRFRATNLVTFPPCSGRASGQRQTDSSDWL
jgi:hypothetical protein